MFWLRNLNIIKKAVSRNTSAFSFYSDDSNNKLEIVASKISTLTKYAQQNIARWEEVRSIAMNAGFSLHIVILPALSWFIRA